MTLLSLLHVVSLNDPVSQLIYNIYVSLSVQIIKDEVLLTVGCTIFPMYLFIAKYLFTGSFKNRSIDI
jgi:hypothetical protein